LAGKIVEVRVINVDETSIHACALKTFVARCDQEEMHEGNLQLLEGTFVACHFDEQTVTVHSVQVM